MKRVPSSTLTDFHETLGSNSGHFYKVSI